MNLHFLAERQVAGGGEAVASRPLFGLFRNLVERGFGRHGIIQGVTTAITSNLSVSAE